MSDNMPPDMRNLIGLDFETYGSVSLPDHGLDRYVSDKYFTPLIGSVTITGPTERIYRTYDWVDDYRGATHALSLAIGSRYIVAHNVPFERRVLAHLGLNYPVHRFIDSAVVARACGAGSKLEAAAPQLLGIDKLEEGKNLIKLFSIPGKYQAENGSPEFDPRVIADHPSEWSLFKTYCEVDSQLCIDIVQSCYSYLSDAEYIYSSITTAMNETGWRVDLPLVYEMQRRYVANQEKALADFRATHDAANLNLNSLKQLKEWCEARGIKARSFDEKHTASLLHRIEKKLESPTTPADKRENYSAVADLLRTKQILGGSSLKKLQTIIDNTGHDGRLRDQYLHAGAGQTLRTSGRSVQMQNLKRLAEVKDMSELDDVTTDWSNTELAQNLRQVFTASDPDGKLIVGDFSSVESRGLAYLAGEQWKLAEYRAGKDLYKVLASKMYHCTYDDVTKSQRQTGKVGELSCGYGAGAGAVLEFAKNMGSELSEAEAGTLVRDWRAANPKVVEFWKSLDDMLHGTVGSSSSYVRHSNLPDGLVLELSRMSTPSSLMVLDPKAQSIDVVLRYAGSVIMRRVFHGCFEKNGQIIYYRPSTTKSGPLWKNWFINPKTKQRQNYTIYGGKLAGIIVQSFCREIFFRTLREVDSAVAQMSNVQLVGQFHDEIVLDWVPGTFTLDRTVEVLTKLMSDPGIFTSFPLSADVKYDYRYTK